MADNPIIGLLNSLGPYQTIGLCLILTTYGPFATRWNWQPSLTPSSSDWYLPWLVFPGIFLVWLLATSSNLSGTIRYGIHTYGHRIPTFNAQTPNWHYAVLLAFVLIPASREWIIVLAPATWQYIRWHHLEAVQDISTRVETAISQATTAANNAKEDATAATSYERQALDLAAVALRDVRLADALKVTDFYDKSSGAWVALHKVTKAAKEATTAAQETLFSATEYQEESSSGVGQARNLYEKAESAHTSAEEAEEAADTAWARTVDFQEAQKNVEDYRVSERGNAKRVADAAQKVVASAVAAVTAARKATEKVDAVRNLAAVAKDIAVKGNIEEANSRAALAEKAAAEVAGEALTANSYREMARRCVQTTISS